MSEITIKKSNIEAAYKVASDETKEVLKALFGLENIFMSKPNLDDYTSIKTYEDACEALGIVPYLSAKNNLVICENGTEKYKFWQNMPPNIIALMKLETISRALWGRTWAPEPDAEGSKWFYYPVFALYTQQEIENMDEYERGGLLSVSAYIGTSAGFGFLITLHRSSNAGAYIGFRLCQENSDKALYFGKQFIELWAAYLQFNFITGERLK